MEITMFILGVGIIIGFGIILFIGYSYKNNQRSKYILEVYKVFKEQYGKDFLTTMGYGQTNTFTSPVTLMVAVNKEDQRVIDVWEVMQQDMENNCRSCEEYIGMDIVKYHKENQKRIGQDQMMQKASGSDGPKKAAFDMAVRQILNKL